MTISAGTKVGRYEIRSKIGEGGMGEVYQAVDTELDRTVAIKVLPEQLASDQQRLQRFIQEAKAASALNHPHILTIYEIGTVGNSRFVATEFIDGETLRERMKAGLKLVDALELSIQIAGALAAAHAAGIIHRDIKPENIMVRRDGYIKVLDFGLAKLTEPEGSTTDTEAPTKALVNTGAGTVMGTANYMSPEQTKGKRVDVRTDLWSLGAVIYEMVTGHVPFEAETPSEVIGLILNKEPPPLARYEREAPPELERIVEKALNKDREERYQTAKDLSVDLKRLRRQLDLEAEIERTVPPELRTSSSVTASSGALARTTSAQHAAAGTASAEAIHQASSAEYIVNEIKRHKTGFALTAAIAIGLILATAVYFVVARRTTALTERDTMLIADFVNTTGDPVFDATLKQALAVQLGQSPFLNIFGDDRVREALRFMGRSADERVTRDIGREICQRQGLKALLAGSISGLGSHYVITLDAINAQTGDAIAREQVEAESKEQVLRALGEAATKLREKLGESLPSIQKFDASIEQATTASLEAFKAYTLGIEQHQKGKYLEAIPLYKRATEIDPNFAVAYARLAAVYSNSRQYELAAGASQKAYDLRDRVSERERLVIAASYYSNVTGEVEKNIETLELWKRTYPRDFVPHNNLALQYNDLGLYEKAVEEAREAIRLNPNAAPAHSNLARAFLGLNRFDEAKQVIERALSQKIETIFMHRTLYLIAFIRSDAATMKDQVDGANGRPDEYAAQGWQADTAAFSGQWRKAQEFSARAVELAQRRDLKEVAAQIIAVEAMQGAFLGDCKRVKEKTEHALVISRSQLAQALSAGALANCGELSQTQAITNELAKRYPRDTLVNKVFLPQIQARVEMYKGNFGHVIQLLETTKPYEAAFLFQIAYLRGLAYLGQQKGAEAAAEFQKILDHRGHQPASALYVLAYVGLARAAVLQGDTAKARKAYQDFLSLWKDADADLPILLEAKKEYEKIK